MKKILLIAALVGGFAASTFAKDTYKLNDASVDQMFAQASDITLTAASSDDMMGAVNTSASVDMSALATGGSQTKMGFLLRSFFCGFIALHRSYMGTDGRALWYMYLCIPVYGGIVNLVDFWSVVFGVDYNKYKNNKKFTVWLK